MNSATMRLTDKVDMKFKGIKLGIFSAMAFFCTSLSALPVVAEDDAAEIYTRIAGFPPDVFSPEFSQMQELLRSGRFTEALRIPMGSSSFLSVRIRDWIAPLLSREGLPYEPFNDAEALWIGIVRDDLDARNLLTGDFSYVPDPRLGLGLNRRDNNFVFEGFEKRKLSYLKFLNRMTPQWPDGASPGSGVLTTRQWGKQFYVGGTNRRAYEASFRIFLCTPIDSLMRPFLPDFRVRRDVERAPGGNPEEYQNRCKQCHSGMDAMSGAFAHADFSDESGFSWSRTPVLKMNQHAEVYPDGYVTVDDSWVNLLRAPEDKAEFGWRGPLQGRGIAQFGAMLANSKRFSSCMVERSFEFLCGRPMTEPEKQGLGPSLVHRFETGGYRFKDLFVDVFTQESCR